MNDKPSKKLFQEIASAQDKVRIISQAHENDSIFRARISSNLEFSTKAITWAPPMRLGVKPPEGIKLGLKPLTVQFESGDEKYFSTADLAFDDWKLFFVFTNPLYRLQRREYQRLRVPPRYKNRVLLMNVNETVWNEECEVLDMSLGGCSLKLSYKSIDIQLGAVVMLDIKLGESPAFIQIGYVRYRKLEKFEGKSKMKVGVEFKPYPKYSQYLQSAVQGLATDIFTHWSQRNSK